MATRLDPTTGVITVPAVFGHGLNPTFPNYFGAKIGFNATHPFPKTYAYERVRLKEHSIDGLDIEVPEPVPPTQSVVDKWVAAERAEQRGAEELRRGHVAHTKAGLPGYRKPRFRAVQVTCRQCRPVPRSTAPSRLRVDVGVLGALGAAGGVRGARQDLVHLVRGARVRAVDLRVRVILDEAVAFLGVQRQAEQQVRTAAGLRVGDVAAVGAPRALRRRVVEGGRDLVRRLLAVAVDLLDVGVGAADVVDLDAVADLGAGRRRCPS